MAKRAPALSPSRANDFRQCPLMFRLRVVDQIPEPPSAAATLGTLVHSVLEGLFDLPAADRTIEAATGMLEPRWSAMRARSPELEVLHDSPAQERTWLVEAGARLATYFTLENPGRLEPAAREEFVEWQLEDGPLLRGVIDRVDVAPDGSIRVVDYKTGKSPAPQYGSQAKFQMRFYALLVERLRGRRASVLQLLYLKDGASVVLHPTEQDLDQIEQEVRSLWDEIVVAATTSTWRTRRSALCGWCSFQALCPEFGGTPPALDLAEVEAALAVTPQP